jgi:hypothetical protein
MRWVVGAIIGAVVTSEEEEESMMPTIRRTVWSCCRLSFAA